MKKNIIFYEKNLKLAKNNTFNNVFCNTIFGENILYNSTDPNFVNK